MKNENIITKIYKKELDIENAKKWVFHLFTKKHMLSLPHHQFIKTLSLWLGAEKFN